MLFCSLPLLILLIDRWNVGACKLKILRGISPSHIPMQSNSFFGGFDDVHIVPFGTFLPHTCLEAVTTHPTNISYYINISTQLYLIIIIIMMSFLLSGKHQHADIKSRQATGIMQEPEPLACFSHTFF